MTAFIGSNSHSVMGRLNVRLKLALGFSISTMAIAVDSLSFLIGLMLTGALIFIATMPSRVQVRLIALLCLLIVWGAMFSQAIFYNQFPRDILFTVIDPNSILRDGLHVYTQGIYYGAVQSFRMIAVLLTGYAICFSTSDDQFLRGFVALKIPFSISFMAVSAIQFVPVAMAEFRQVRTAMRLKGYRPFKTGFRRTLKTELGSLGTILAGTIRRSEEKAVSILTRGFSVNGVRSAFREDTLSIKEKAAIFAILSTVGGIVAMRMLFWCYQYQLFYRPELRWVYGFVRNWL
jgi:energy-coupling factor transport system permease protein